MILDVASETSSTISAFLGKFQCIGKHTWSLHILHGILKRCEKMELDSGIVSPNRNRILGFRGDLEMFPDFLPDQVPQSF